MDNSVKNEEKKVKVVDYKSVKEEKENVVEFANIDKDILEIALNDNVYETMQDSVKRKRVIVNFLAEFLSSLKAIDKNMDEVAKDITICTSDKVLDFFIKTKDNIEKEENKQKAKAIVEQSHQKPKK